MTVIEYAKSVGVQPSSVYGKIKRNTLPHKIVDGYYEVDENTPWTTSRPGVKVGAKKPVIADKQLPF